MIDAVLRNARLYDGTGGPPIDGDLAIHDGRIVSVGEPAADGTAREDLDLTGFAVAPGFIDLHTHSDVSLLSDPGCLSAIEQGITTQSVGLCGPSAGPVSPESLEGMIEEEPVFAFPGVAWDWTSIGGYREAVARARPATNVTTMVGQTRCGGSSSVAPTGRRHGRARADALARPRGDRRGRPRVHHRAV